MFESRSLANTTVLPPTGRRRAITTGTREVAVHRTTLMKGIGPAVRPDYVVSVTLATHAS